MDLALLRRAAPAALAALAVVLLGAGAVTAARHAGDGSATVPAAHAGHGDPVVAGGPGASGGLLPGTRSVADLTGPQGTPDVRFVLTARHAALALDSGAPVDALTFDGTLPGPELRVREGELVEVVLRNADVAEGVTLHWHGLDVPNAEDAVGPGGEHTYRFRPDQVSTFWYHSHQDPAQTVPRGLFGALVVEPAAGVTGVDTVLLGHTFGHHDVQSVAIGSADRPTRRDVPAGTRVRARLVNTDSTDQTWTVTGEPFTVAAIDGADVHGPTPLQGARLAVPAGGRIDVEFTAPATVALLADPAPGSGSGPTPPSRPPTGPSSTRSATGRPPRWRSPSTGRSTATSPKSSTPSEWCAAASPAWSGRSTASCTRPPRPWPRASMVELLPGAAAAAPGQTGGPLIDLPPGRYFLVCPVGDEGQAPHYMEGMINELTVA